MHFGRFPNPLSHHPDFEGPWERSLLKILWEKEKILVTNIFSFSHNVFYLSQYNFQFFQSHLFCSLQVLSALTSLEICRFVKGSLSNNPDFHGARKDLSLSLSLSLSLQLNFSVLKRWNTVWNNTENACLQNYSFQCH